MKQFLIILVVLTSFSACQKDSTPETEQQKQQKQLQNLSGRWNLVNSAVDLFIPATNPVPAFTDFKVGQAGDYLIFSGTKVLVYEQGSNVADTFAVAFVGTTLTVTDDNSIFKIETLNSNSDLRLSMDTILFGNRQKIISNLKR